MQYSSPPTRKEAAINRLQNNTGEAAGKVSVIVPVLNEQATISKVIEQLRANELVGEVLVVDDKSIDDTVAVAKSAGASVMTSTRIGKGASMRDGMLAAKHDVVVYLDGDVEGYVPNIVERLACPILKNDADFVKATFGREAGRVTELVAKPLISLLFPELQRFSQPLCGMIAGRKELFSKVTFEDDFGVDIGILLDVYRMGARIAEVNIGAIRHKMKPWQELGRMSREVARAILKRASSSSFVNLDSLQTINIIRDQMEYAIHETTLQLQKLIIFDMDDTILVGRFVDVAAEKRGFKKQLVEIITRNQEPFLRTKLIARLFAGMNIAELIEIVEQMPVVADIFEVVSELKGRGYRIGIVSDSYDFVATHIKNKIGADFALANELEFSQSIATGEVKIPSFFARSEKSTCSHSLCKSNALRTIANQHGIDLSNVIAVGDSEADICMVSAAGIGVAFCSRNEMLNIVADQRIDVRSFAPLLEIAG